MKRGIVSAAIAYALWGLLPVYWKWLREVPAPEVLSHRIIWSFLTLLIIILATRRFGELVLHAWSRRVLKAYTTAALLIGVNWLVYIWAVGAGYIVETSLGYFITPLLNVLLGVVVLGERLRPWQTGSIILAASGVLFLAVTHGALPWIALTLAATFSLYGLVKKTAPLSSLDGLAMETALLALPALVFLVHSALAGKGSFLHAGAATDALLAGAGLITVVPLLLFSSAARRIPLSLIGILQYIAPTLQFLIGVLVYREPFSREKFIGFGIVWLALIIYAVESFFTHRAQLIPVVPE